MGCSLLESQLGFTHNFRPVVTFCLPLYFFVRGRNSCRSRLACESWCLVCAVTTAASDEGGGFGGQEQDTEREVTCSGGC